MNTAQFIKDIDDNSHLQTYKKLEKQCELHKDIAQIFKTTDREADIVQTDKIEVPTPIIDFLL